MPIPGEFFLARRATVVVHRGGPGDDQYSIEVILDDGTMFPRTFAGKTQAGLSSQSFGPVPIDSPIEEDTKFMDIRRLHELLADPTRSQRIRQELTKIIREDQSASYLEGVLASIKAHGRHRFAASDKVFELTRGKAEPRLHKGVLTVSGVTWVEEFSDGNVSSAADVEELKLTARPTLEGRMSVVAELHNAVIRSGDDNVIGRQSFQRTLTVPMPPEVRAIADRKVNYYLTSTETPAPPARGILLRETLRLGNSIYSEMHGRASFAVSCLILVMVGCALGMMFKSGNFLTAFALSVVPALLCIALIVTGQNTCESIPWRLENFHNPLNAGLTLIWSGNAAVLVLAAVLNLRLQRQ
jgi:hypothetical protein